MYLVRLVYASSISEAFTHSDVESILGEARDSNAKTNLSGVLCFSSHYFLQCLEGSRAKVNETYHRILKDPRHENVVMLDYKEIVGREFAEWSMGYIPQSSLSRDVILRYSGSPDFEPYQMSGESAYQLLSNVGQTVPLLS
jgi:hypothetical protein